MWRLLVLTLVGCGCPAYVVEDVIGLPDGGVFISDAGYCADQCQTTSDCQSGWHCSLHPSDQAGLCFRNGH